MRRTLLITAPLLAVLAACGTNPPPAAPPAPSKPAPPPPPTLGAEQRRLAALFEGTPVVFALQRDGSLRVTVPLHYCFDQGLARVKRPLGAVLDRLAKSQLSAASTFRVAAPSDAGARGLDLARERALATRDYLMGQRLASTRLQAAGVAQTEGIEIVVTDAPAH
jgi:outer membrane protein OmpA-like peptidoglycan-associated protein